MESDAKTPIEMGITIDHEIQWVEEQKRLNDIRPFERNPRNITETQYEKIKRSLLKHGQFAPLLVTQDLRMMGGHQRLRAMRELGWETCRVSMPKQHLSDEQFVELMLLHNHNNGTWDIDMLANDYDLEFLRQDIGLHEVQNISPFDTGEDTEPSQSGSKKVRCPQCCHEFPAKGNSAGD